MLVKNIMDENIGEVKKLQDHLSLLREQYVRIQEKCELLEEKLALNPVTENLAVNSFMRKLSGLANSLYEKDEYSDLTINLVDKDVPGHRFVFAARGNNWNVASFTDTKVLDWRGFDADVGSALLKWIYTDHIDLMDHQLTLKLIRAAANFQLKELISRCEESLIGWVDVRNCVQFYTTAEDVGAEMLKNHCSSLISTHWNDFTPEDFAHMSAPLLYSMFKAKTKHLLHAAVRLQREDVLFLYLIEFDSLLPDVLNKVDDCNRLALDLALQSEVSSIPSTLLKHGASVDAIDSNGNSLLHLAVQRGDCKAAKFLIKNGANTNTKCSSSGNTAFHLIALFKDVENDLNEFTEVAKLLIAYGADPNVQNAEGKTSLHLAVENQKTYLLNALLEYTDINLDIKDSCGLPPLWYSFLHSKEDFTGTSIASLLVERGALVNEKLKDGNTLLHLVACKGLEEAGLFLIAQKASLSICNFMGETPLHVSCTHSLPELSSALLKAGVEPNLQTYPPLPIRSCSNGSSSPSNPFDVQEEELTVFGETALHRAIRNEHFSVVKAILDHKGALEKDKTSRLVSPSLDLRDSDGLTCLGVAVTRGYLSIAESLLSFGANVDACDNEGRTLLLRVLSSSEGVSVRAARFLIGNGADTNRRTLEGLSPLLICIQSQINELVENLCAKGADVNEVSPITSDRLLWLALDSDQLEIASVLVRHKADLDCWGTGPEGCLQTLLHRAIDCNREDIACFLVNNGASVDALRREGPGGRGMSLAREKQTPLHMCCSWGLTETAKTLIGKHAKINQQDFEGNTPFHLSLENNHEALIDTLLEEPSLDLRAKNKAGKTPFSLAMSTKNIKAAKSILHKHPTAAEQFDSKGLTYLHSAVLKEDLEAVLFLLSIHVSLSERTRDDRQFTPLHLAAVQGSEMILRNLLLAGASIDDVTPQKQTCLHLCSVHDRPQIAVILLQNSINVDAVDCNLDNALHVAVKEGHLSLVRVLLTESRINAGAINLRGRNPLHMLGAYPKDNAAAIAQLLLEMLPDFPLDNCDVDGNTALLLAYMNGSGQLCRVLVRSGACLGTPNKQGVHLFNYEVATRTLLQRLLDVVTSEPPWTEGDFCLECDAKFTLATRRHHCRHCGRVLCNKCSSKDVPILKFDIKKPVRVCQMCFDVLTLGPSSPT